MVKYSNKLFGEGEAGFMRNALENITLLQKRMNELQLENQILKGILERLGISYAYEWSSHSTRLSR